MCSFPDKCHCAETLSAYNSRGQNSITNQGQIAHHQSAVLLAVFTCLHALLLRGKVTARSVYCKWKRQKNNWFKTTSKSLKLPKLWWSITEDIKPYRLFHQLLPIEFSRLRRNKWLAVRKLTLDPIFYTSGDNWCIFHTRANILTLWNLEFLKLSEEKTSSNRRHLCNFLCFCHVILPNMVRSWVKNKVHSSWRVALVRFTSLLDTKTMRYVHYVINFYQDLRKSAAKTAEFEAKTHCSLIFEKYSNAKGL